MDPSDRETSPRVEQYQGGRPTSPAGDLKHMASATTTEPPSPGGIGHHNRTWTPAAAAAAIAVVPQEREEDIHRRRRMVEIQSEIEEMQRRIDVLRAEQRSLQAQDPQEPRNNNTTNHHHHRHFGSMEGNGMPWDAGSPGPPPPPPSLILNPRPPKEGYPGNNNEAIARFVQQGPLDDPVRYPLGTRLGDGSKAGPAHGVSQVESNHEIGNDTSSMISPPETVASPPGETPAAAAAAAAAAAPVGAAHPCQDFSRAPSAAPAPPYAGPRERLHTFPPPIQPVRTANNTTNNSNAANCVSGGRKVAGGPGGKIYRCAALGCKSTFARNCELRYVSKRNQQGICMVAVVVVVVSVLVVAAW